MISTHLYIHKLVLNDGGYHLSKKKKKPKQSKPTHLSNYLNKMKRKILKIQDSKCKRKMIKQRLRRYICE
jgi:hypothetical protein